MFFELYPDNLNQRVPYLLVMSPSRSGRRKPRKKKSHRNLILIVAFMVIIALIAGVVALSGGNRGNNSPKASGDGSVNGSGSEKVRIETNMGDVVIELRDDVPNTTSNFVGLVQQGVYNDTIFHRVVNIPNNLVIIQGGDPTGTGYGDPSIPSIPDEFSDNPENNENRRGTIAMANAGPNTGSSQFFINGEYNNHLDNLHPVFGDVIEGMDVVDEILNVPTNENKPIDDVILISATIVQ
jgi:peptidylprolyl isomerase